MIQEGTQPHVDLLPYETHAIILNSLSIFHHQRC